MIGSLIKRATLVSLLMGSATALANDKPAEDRLLWRSFRVGGCVGMSVDCLAASFKADFSPRYVGVSVNTALAWGGATLKAYPLDYHRGNVRPYAYYGVGYAVLISTYRGFGVGTDVLLGKSRNVVVQPSVGVLEGDRFDDLSVSGQLSVMRAF